MRVASRAPAAGESPVQRGPVRQRVEGAQRLPPWAKEVAGPRFGALAALALGALGRSAVRVVRQETFQTPQAPCFLCQIAVRDPCLLQSALNGPKCNGKYEREVAPAELLEMIEVIQPSEGLAPAHELLQRLRAGRRIT